MVARKTNRTKANTTRMSLHLFPYHSHDKVSYNIAVTHVGINTTIVIIIIIVLRRCGDWCWHSWSASSPPPSSGSNSSPREAPIWEEGFFYYFHTWIYLFLYCLIYLFNFSINPQVDLLTERSCDLGIFLIPSHAIQPSWAEIESISSGSRLSLWKHTTNTQTQQQHNTSTTQTQQIP